MASGDHGCFSAVHGLECRLQRCDFLNLDLQWCRVEGVRVYN